MERRASSSHHSAFAAAAAGAASVVSLLRLARRCAADADDSGGLVLLSGAGFERLQELNQAYRRVDDESCSGRAVLASASHRIFYCTREGANDEACADRWHIVDTANSRVVAFANDHRDLEQVAWMCWSEEEKAWVSSPGRLRSVLSDRKLEAECAAAVLPPHIGGLTPVASPASPAGGHRAVVRGLHGQCHKTYDEHLIAGFRVMVERGCFEAFGLRLVHQLQLDLHELGRVIPGRWLARMRGGMRIWLNRASRQADGTPLSGACHHESACWLRDNGNMPEKAHSVEIYDAFQYLHDRCLWSGVLPHEAAHWVHSEAMEEEAEEKAGGGQARRGTEGWVPAPALTVSVPEAAGAVRVAGFGSSDEPAPPLLASSSSSSSSGAANGIYRETGELCSGSPVYRLTSSNLRSNSPSIYLYRTDSGSRDVKESAAADRWHLEARPPGQTVHILAYACGGSSDVRSCDGRWWVRGPRGPADGCIVAAFDAAAASGKYHRPGGQERTARDGRTRFVDHPAYCMTNHKEYFAVCSTAFFSSRRFHNDYFPFTHAELRRFDEGGFRMCETVWRVAGKDVPSRQEMPAAYPQRGHSA